MAPVKNPLDERALEHLHVRRRSPAGPRHCWPPLPSLRATKQMMLRGLAHGSVEAAFAAKYPA